MCNYTVYNQPYKPELRSLKEGKHYEPYYILNGQTFFYTGFEQNETLVIPNVINDLYNTYLDIIGFFCNSNFFDNILKKRIIEANKYE